MSKKPSLYILNFFVWCRDLNERKKDIHFNPISEDASSIPCWSKLFILFDHFHWVLTVRHQLFMLGTRLFI